jgi:hypothetical protein
MRFVHYDLSFLIFVFLPSQSSVLPAQTKDKKMLDGVEVAVSLAWRSTLYVTNFPEDANDEWIRSKFSPVRQSRRLPNVINIEVESFMSPHFSSLAVYLMFGGRAKGSKAQGGFVTFNSLLQ